jgi:hypothetical protein
MAACSGDRLAQRFGAVRSGARGPDTPVRPGAAGRAASCKEKAVSFSLFGPAPAEIQSRRRLRGAVPCCLLCDWAERCSTSGPLPVWPPGPDPERVASTT